MRVIRQHVGSRGHAPRFQLDLLRLLPVVHKAAAQPANSKGGFPNCQRSPGRIPDSRELPASPPGLQPPHRDHHQSAAECRSRQTPMPPGGHRAASRPCAQMQPLPGAHGTLRSAPAGPRSLGLPVFPMLSSPLKYPGVDGICPNDHAQKGELLNF